MIPCPKCSRENDDKALYCDQCRTPVSPESQGAVLDEDCPACGGEVREVPSTAAECSDCGLALGDGGPREGGGAAEPGASAKATAKPAVPTDAPAADDGDKSPCPVCGTENGTQAESCADCGLGFGAAVGSCPKCSAEAEGDKCECGAVLTLARLLEYVDGSVKVVCSTCKQLFTVDRAACSDCGGPTRPADALKALSAARRR